METVALGVTTLVGTVTGVVEAIVTGVEGGRGAVPVVGALTILVAGTKTASVGFVPVVVLLTQVTPEALELETEKPGGQDGGGGVIVVCENWAGVGTEGVVVDNGGGTTGGMFVDDVSFDTGTTLLTVKIIFAIELFADTLTV